ncbi:NADH-ubiquinone oxidoreductase subunit B17.2, putative [Pediculus humanus corporis]|uniref:NADH dehydrogenase [ubiquinone] 1 alpha subcomplex subunit 12 n=1 Tax=Pediculus humanus subsp. corporis TaxID=121224 RepID=E0VEB0_PEDHC|nr:NADH-ubiquinone oxidoreductase subunit B17.2, putative [Pediculus humanus corporis]EEB11716.1 NADH-ubiquinone oxidoreductase subunit B17.2, putative [Pediculus humanus corporis]
MSYLGLDKFQNFMKIIKAHGGFLQSFIKLNRIDDLKLGKLVGSDRFGNKYYENDSYFYGRNRWVIYSDRFGYDYDASHVDPQWYGWLHYKTDILPYEDPSRPKHKWLAKESYNMTGTDKQYVPYSTTKPKIQSWVPPKSKK